jgi:probable phosphoglycerate mutase
LHRWDFALILSSPLKRAVETCRLAGYGDGAQLRPDLMEWDYGSYDGKTSKEIVAGRPDWSLWRDGGPDGETANDVGKRTDRVIAEVRRTDGDVLIFAHGHVLRVLTARWLGQPPQEGRHYALETAALSVLSYEHVDPVIRRWNRPVS